MKKFIGGGGIFYDFFMDATLSLHGAKLVWRGSVLATILTFNDLGWVNYK